MKKTALIAILVISAFFMSCGNEPTTPVETKDVAKLPVKSVNIAGSEVRLTVAKTNIERIQASEDAQIEQSESVYNGILYVYDGVSPVTFRQKLMAYSTDIAFLNTEGEITKIYALPPTPHNPDMIKSSSGYVEYFRSMAQQNQRDFTPEMEEYYTELSKNIAISEGFVSWAFPKNPAVEVKYIIQLPGGFFDIHKLNIGQKIELTEELTKLNGEPKKPVVEFVYERILDRRDDTKQEKKYFTVDLAETLEKRSHALSAERLNNLKSDEMIALCWKTKQQINFNVSDPQLVKPLYIVPIEYNSEPFSNVTGEFIFMEPPAAPNTEVGAVAENDLKGDPSYRNYSFKSIDKYNCLLIMSKESINDLKLQKNELTFKIPPEWAKVQAEDDPESFDVSYRLSSEDKTYKAKVKVIQDEIGRRRGLKLAQPLPKFEKPAEDAEEIVSNGYLLRFDRVRQRPVFCAGLPAPFDLALIDAKNEIVQVVEVSEKKLVYDNELMEFSKEAYQSVWIMPFKWFNSNGLATTDEEGNTQYAKGKLLISRALSRTMPEPTRYKILIENVPVWVEIFLTPSERTRGLQFVNQLKPDHGALFLYKDHNDTMEFWMPNCLIDLSILYIDKNWVGKNVKQMLHPYDPDQTNDPEVKQNRPQNDPESLREFAGKYNSKYKVEFAIEMERGWFIKNNIARFVDDKYNTTDEPDEYYTDVELIGLPKVTIINGSPVETFLENIKK